MLVMSAIIIIIMIVNWVLYAIYWCMAVTFLRTIVLKLSAKLLLARLATSRTFSDCN